jgi:hypothetical protein
MDRTTPESRPAFTQPVRQIALMLLILAMVGAGAWLARDVVAQVFWTNVLLNAFILGVFVIGVLSCFWQVVALIASVSWIEGFVARRPGVDAGDAPRLLAPLAALFAGRATARMQISPSSQRSILDSVATRIDEARDIARYLGNLLIFLGLLGTFWGLATTVPAMVETIRGLVPEEGESGTAVFGRLMAGLESQLGGIGTAFSSSLLGLAGSLVIGLLELFAGHGQNRFYRELEEWLSTITRVDFAAGAGDGETGAAGVLAQILADLKDMQTAEAEARAALAAEVGALAEAVRRMAARGTPGTAELARIAAASEAQLAALKAAAAEDNRTALAALERLAVGQDAMIAALAQPDGGPDAESRMRLRSIDVQLLRILEEISAGRQESMADLRADLTALTVAVRQLGRSTGKG